MSVGRPLGEGGGRRGLVGRGLVGRGLVGSGGGTSDASEVFLKDFVLVLLVTFIIGISERTFLICASSSC